MAKKFSSDQIEVKHHPEAKRFEVSIEDYLAKAEYILTKQRIIFTHTEVPNDLEGNGIGAALAKTGLQYARDNKLEVMPLCPFFASYIRRHPEYKDLLAPGVNV
ncbi:MAG TPA: GNAT family N-acetyltransferase [Saprospiraceae bacterium]|nr:GNAT family N-acetyltransferase [Saprospiraceae bacterium]